MFKKQQKQTTTYEKTTIHNNFHQTIDWLEKYIEVAGYYSDWESRKQIHDNSIRQKDVINNPEKAEELFSHQLLALSTSLEDTPPFFQEELKREFYKWLSATGIDINNCPQRLKHFLFGFNKVLEGRGEKLKREEPFLTHSAKEELEKELKKTPMQEEREIQRSFESKSKFSDSVEQGKEVFEQIAESVVNKHDRFNFFSQRERDPIRYDCKAACLPQWSWLYNSPQQISSETIIQDLRSHPQNWIINEISTEIDSSGWTKKQEFVLIHRSVWEKDFDLEGKLNFNNKPIYRANRFNQTEIEEINKSLSSYQGQRHLASLIKQRSETKDKTPGDIEEVIRFKTWWSDYNVATVVNYHKGYYWVFLVVYEPEKGNERGEVKWDKEIFIFPKCHDCDCWGIYKREKYGSIEGAQGEAGWLRGKLDGENPILLVHPYANNYENFNILITSPYAIRKEVPSETSVRPNIHLFFPLPLNPPITIKHHYPSNPSSYLKPLDIVKVKCIDCILSPSIPLNLTGEEYFYHVGVYLGKIDGEYKVCHFTKSANGTRVHSWKKFLEGGSGELVRYHPIIPFKHYSKIARQIAWAERENFREDDYNLANRNCEHFANMIVYGINYSEQIEDKKDLIIAKNIGVTSLFPLPSLIFNNYSINNGKGSTIKLTNEMSETNDKLGWITTDWSEWIERQYLQEVPAKETCRIM